MTATIEDTEVSVEDTSTPEGTDTEGTSEAPKKRKRRAHDFTKFRDFHQEVADYVNARSGLDPVSPNQVKAVLLLRTDFANTPEQIAAREASKAALEAEKKRYAGLTEDQVKKVKAAQKAAEQAERFQKRAQEQIDLAKKLAEEAEGSGTDLAAAVEAQQNGEITAGTVEPEGEPKSEPQKRRGLGQRNR
jgi:hypothetical protein